ncbi:hypothetical protein BDV59DRAFT_126600 [Aspergillus ambiguus]|uniref:uncharacterized protein n=1 Tax=Aspergillus ambiguus TaxID=176160 RepID=UPI003CCD2833
MKFDLVFSFLALLAYPTSVVSTLEYCSSVNTGSSNAGNSSIYQSNGLCTTQCSSDYAFGIVQGNECWCSNIAPNKATNVDVSKCDEECPGYPDDSCGSTSDALYGYIAMDGHNPSGTATAPSSSSTSTSSKSDSPTGDATTTGKTAVETQGGVVKTITVPNSQPTSTSTSGPSSSDDGSNLSGGAIAGVVVGSLGGCAAIAAVIFLVILARRRQRSPSPDPSVQNILVDGRNSKSSQMSFMRGFSDNHSHTLSAGSSTSPGRLPTFTDNRMKTDTVLFPNGRRNSEVSLQDNEDYSRPVLRLTNPD